MFLSHLGALRVQITLIATLAYLVIATGLGDAQWVAFVDWIISTPLLLIDLAFLANMAPVQVLFLAFVDILMIAAGFGAQMADTHGQRWSLFAFSCLMFAIITVTLVKYLHLSAKESAGTVEGRAYRFLSIMTLCLWAVYPLVFVLGHLDVMGHDLETLIHAGEYHTVSLLYTLVHMCATVSDTARACPLAQGRVLHPTPYACRCISHLAPSPSSSAVLDINAKAIFGLILVGSREALEGETTVESKLAMFLIGIDPSKRRASLPQLSQPAMHMMRGASIEDIIRATSSAKYGSGNTHTSDGAVDGMVDVVTMPIGTGSGAFSPTTSTSAGTRVAGWGQHVREREPRDPSVITRDTAPSTVIAVDRELGTDPSFVTSATNPYIRTPQPPRRGVQLEAATPLGGGMDILMSALAQAALSDPAIMSQLLGKLGVPTTATAVRTTDPRNNHNRGVNDRNSMDGDATPELSTNDANVTSTSVTTPVVDSTSSSRAVGALHIRGPMHAADGTYSSAVATQVPGTVLD